MRLVLSLKNATGQQAGEFRSLFCGKMVVGSQVEGRRFEAEVILYDTEQDQTETNISRIILGLQDILNAHERDARLDIPVGNLDLSTRARGILRAAEIKTVGELLDFGACNLLKQKNAGRKTLIEIDYVLRRINLSLS